MSETGRNLLQEYMDGIFLVCNMLLLLCLRQLSDFPHCMDGMSYDSWLWEQ